MLNFSEYSLPVNILVFCVAAVAVWIAGTKLTWYADAIANRYNLSQAMLGLILLAGVTSLPEIATSFTAALDNNAELAVNNLLGSIAMQVAILAIADGMFGQRALTSVVPDPVVMLQGAINIYLLSLVVLAVLVGDKALMGAGFWTWSLLIMTLFCFKKITEGTRQEAWHIDEKDKTKISAEAKKNDKTYENTSSAILIIRIVVSAMVILFAGFIVARVGDTIANQSGLGSSFVGVSLVAIATSLPEASTVFASVRRGLYTMAISDILGTNILNVALIFFVDFLTQGKPVLSVVKEFAAAAAILGVVLVSMFLIGLIERRDRTIFKFGRDSVAVITVYLAGMVFLFFMRS